MGVRAVRVGPAAAARPAGRRLHPGAVGCADARIREEVPVGDVAAGAHPGGVRADHAVLQPPLQPAGRTVAADVPPRGLRRRTGRRHEGSPAELRPHPETGAGMSTPRSLTHPGRTGLLLVTPAVLFVGVFVLVPLAFALVISLTNWPLIGSVKFSGLKNYTAIVSDAAFAKSVLYTLLYT